MRVASIMMVTLTLHNLGSSTCSLLAEFDQKGLRGQVGFLRSAPGGEVTVAASIKGAVKGEVFVWKVYSIPVQPYEQCVPSNYGQEVLDLSEEHGLLEADSTVGVGDLELRQLVERPLVLKSLTTLRVVCATLRPAAPITTYVATFVAILGGKIIFRQVEDGSQSVTGVRSNLVATSTRVKVPTTVTWRLVSRSYETEDVTLSNMREGCASLGHFPGSMVHEALYPVPLGGITEEARHYEMEKLPSLHTLATEGSVYVVVYLEDHVLACSRLIRSQPRRATAVFSTHSVKGGVEGSLEMYQLSPVDPVKLSVNLTLPRGGATAFGIDNFAVGNRASCSGLSHRFYGPWHVDLDLTPVPQQGTKDLYPAGDLSGKFGTLTGLRAAAATLTDPTITLFGQYSVIGRGVAVYDTNWRVLGCADLESQTPQVSAVAVFSGNISGILHLSQPTDSIFTETHVNLHLYRTADVNTVGHKWHVHERALDRTGDCISAGSHFNPFSISLTDRQKYSTTPLPHTSYEVGDLHSKLGSITIPGQHTLQLDFPSGRYQWTDESLPLLGEASVLNKALVVHDTDGGAPRIACANIVMNDVTQ
ncbi:uncharacterized protein [Panulirus ornatus]|uniref:uncharacterized protein isoform X2 n=1 Tax=Panulirus ornatus TaxID=150431 RepID=UPI003A883140